MKQNNGNQKPSNKMTANKKTSVKKTSHKKKGNRLSSWRFWIVLGSGVVVVGLLSVALVRVYTAYRTNFVRMENLSKELVDLRSAMNIDSVRQYKIQKILRIMEKHNPSLSSADAYDIANEIHEMSIKYTNLDIDLLCAVITHESGRTWDAEVVSHAGAMGLMQIMPVTGFFLAKYEGISWTTPEEVIFNPIYNIRMGSRFLSMLSERYGLDGALAAYNGGERQAVLWLANGKDDQYLWSETRQYIPSVLELYDVYQAEGL